MVPQDTFMVAAPVRPGQLDALRALLGSMNRAPGVVDPMNTLVPFKQFRTLHYARFVILDDQTLDDLAAYGRVFSGCAGLSRFSGRLRWSLRPAVESLRSGCGTRPARDLWPLPWI